MRMLSFVYYHVAMAIGAAMRNAKYSIVSVEDDGATIKVRKVRAWYAPALIAAHATLMKVLNAGVRVLPNRRWAAHEQYMFARLYNMQVRTGAAGVLVVPRIEGRTLSSLLADEEVADDNRMRALALAVASLAYLHQRGFTHGDAMADNVMVSLAAGIARWFDFENMHDSKRSKTWRQADDLRALVDTVMVRCPVHLRGNALQVIIYGYPDVQVMRQMRSVNRSIWQRALPVHLGQAPLAFVDWHEVATMIEVIAGESEQG